MRSARRGGRCSSRACSSRYRLFTLPGPSTSSITRHAGLKHAAKNVMMGLWPLLGSRGQSNAVRIVSSRQNSSADFVLASITDPSACNLLMATGHLKRVPRYTVPNAPSPMTSPNTSCSAVTCRSGPSADRRASSWEVA